MAPKENDLDHNQEIQSESSTESLEKTEAPKMFRVFILNDHYTPMDFVVEVLISVFNKTAAEATALMLDIHRKGSGAVGVFTYDIAMTKINAVHKMARAREYPLKCDYEEA
jgi:ATP-dependent Clp protease adaptor protein ClpS